MKEVVHGVLIVALVLQGCSTTHVISRESTADDYRRMNETIANKQCAVLLTGGGTEPVTALTVDPQAIQFLDRKTQNRRVIPTLNVRRITVKNRSRGGRNGFVAGLVIGGAICFSLAGQLGRGMNDSTASDREAFMEAAIPGGLLGGLLCGLVLGLPIGYASGAKENYVFKHDAAQER